MQYGVLEGCGLSRYRKGIRRGLFPVLVAAILVFAATGCERGEKTAASEQRPKPEVTVVTITPRDVPVTFEYIAQVQSSRQVNIQARVDGFLDKRVYVEGDIVKAGQTLFIMDQKPFKVQLEHAEASLARQEAALEVARRNLKRVKPLAKANALSQKDLDEATGQYESAEASVAAAKATVAQAELNLSYTVIKSPVDGITSYAQQAEGTYLSPSNSQLTTVAVISPIYVNFSISENDFQQYRNLIAEGSLRPPEHQNYTAEVVLVDGSIYPHTGKVTFAAPSYDAQTGTFMIRVTVENPDNVLRPNQYVHLRLKGGIRPNAVVIPQRAVQQGAKGHFVWVVNKEGKTEYRPIVVGDWVGNDIFVTEGLHEGDWVVVDGGLTLRPGEAVAAKAYVPEKKSSPAGAEPKAGTAKTGADTVNSKVRN